MGRLIDADKLIKTLEVYRLKMLTKYHEKDYDSYYGGILLTIQEVINDIKKQETAFDVDAVVKHLIDKKQESAIEKLNAIDECQDRISIIYCSREAAYKNAIEIVKGAEIKHGNN